MARMSHKKRMAEANERLSRELGELKQVREAAAELLKALALEPPKRVKTKKAEAALEQIMLTTARCGCGRYASYHRTLTGGICETCMST